MNRFILGYVGGAISTGLMFFFALAWWLERTNPFRKMGFGS